MGIWGRSLQDAEEFVVTVVARECGGGGLLEAKYLYIYMYIYIYIWGETGCAGGLFAWLTRLGGDVAQVGGPVVLAKHPGRGHIFRLLGEKGNGQARVWWNISVFFP